MRPPLFFPNCLNSVRDINNVLRAHKEEIRRKYGVIIIGVFGSFARGEQEEASDVDILVELERSFLRRADTYINNAPRI